ncbi:response regulator [Leeuwenhoekiella sp. MAR_2009_132]|uniref:response regulator n=1 Tax=Leeuwenhoekiella sp. MAR_2009_132 TaxID=1392489 RepID=UPI00049002C6|nr:response regulator [Leeuwenhoekiella sp. MAR_2009_132]
MSNRLKIMLVDDQKMANFINKKLIAVTELAAEVIDYTLPEIALAEVEFQKPDVIFLDLNMPVINGWKFLDSLTEAKNFTKVVILTSSTSEIDREKAQNYTQVIDFLIKPLTKDIMLSLKSKLY